MNSMRFILVVLSLATLSFVRPLWATSWSNDQSDLWWNSDENGWGIQFVQRGNTIFATMFVYDAAGNPTWYVATMQGTRVSGVLTFTGDLYATHGPWFGAVPYLAGTVGGGKVGTMTWQKQSGNPGTLTYSVNGVNVTKSLTRQLIGRDDYTGTYLTGLHVVASGCANPAKNGPTDGPSTFTIAQNGDAISMTLVEVGCTLVGTYSQNGQFGTASGNYSCTNGDTGTFDLSNMVVTPFAMAALVSTSSATTGCQNAGQIGGARSDK